MSKDGTDMPALIIPASLVSRSDASRLIRELERLDNEVRAESIRHQPVDVSRVSGMLADLAAANNLDLANQDHRVQTSEALRHLKVKAPIVHVTFAEYADPEFMQQIVAWSREQLHPSTLIHIGLQPGIIAGCIVRTPSHIYDFSIQQILKSKKPMLLKHIQA